MHPRFLPLVKTDSEKSIGIVIVMPLGRVMVPRRAKSGLNRPT